LFQIVKFFFSQSMISSVPWLRATTHPTLAEGELHVWRASLQVEPAVLTQFERHLNEVEVERAGKFLVPRAREYFVGARGFLRKLLGAYLMLEPGGVNFLYGPQGKPQLSTDHTSRLCFNVSHSDDVALFAFAIANEVGVDIERVRPDFGGMEIASHFFSEKEVVALREIPSHLADKAFFQVWTQKEAYVKAHGGGLSIPLRDFTVDFTRSEQVLGDITEAPWTCYALEPARGFAGAVVIEGEGQKLSCFEWGGANFRGSTSG
jgi:4'-phosphopantetheinyl transferase